MRPTERRMWMLAAAILGLATVWIIIAVRQAGL